MKVIYVFIFKVLLRVISNQLVLGKNAFELYHVSKGKGLLSIVVNYHWEIGSIVDFNSKSFVQIGPNRL